MIASAVSGLIEFMLVAFFESIKYVGHLVPVSFLRVFVGYYYLNQALLKFQGDFLTRPRLAAQVAEGLPQLQASAWYKSFLENILIPQWQTAAFVLTGLEFAIAFSYLLGFVVRPVALLGAILSLNFLILSSSTSVFGSSDLHRLFLAVHFTMAWLGAGRCLGFDYFFFKRRRGIWW